MSKLQENIIKFFNRIFKKNSTPMIANVSQENYNEYHKTYDTLAKISKQLNGMQAYIIGDISATIQTNQDLCRQSDNIDIMCNETDLPKLIETLQNLRYNVTDKLDIKAESRGNLDGNFHTMNHELHANTQNDNLLGIGIHTYQVKGNTVITHSYAFDEKTGRVIETEKIMPRELFDLMYDNQPVDYKGSKIMTQSKEYIYLEKSRSSRKEDTLDASIIEPTLDNDSKAKIDRIKMLEDKTETYKIIYDKDGNIKSTEKEPSIEEKINIYLDSLFAKDLTMSPEQIVSNVLQSDKYRQALKYHSESEMNKILANWQTTRKNYTYKNKIELLTNIYSSRLYSNNPDSFKKEEINEVLDFLRQRRNKHGEKTYVSNNGELVADEDALSDRAKGILNLMKEYGEAIKKVFIDNNINLTHITPVAPEQIEGGKLRKFNRPNMYETDVVNAFFAGSTPIDGHNPYMARLGPKMEMVLLGKSTYIYSGNNMEVSQDSDGKKHLMLKQPNYIYHINPASFTPVCFLHINPNTHKPVFEFADEWISDTEVDISNPDQVRGVETVRDVTSLLDNYIVLCDIQDKGIGMQTKQLNHKEAIEFVSKKIKDGTVINMNKETRKK